MQWISFNIPDDVKAHYGITDAAFPESCAVIIYENITKGTRIIVKDSFTYLNCTISIMSNISYENMGAYSTEGIRRGSYYLQKIQIWTKPLPEDWVKL